MIPFNPWVLTMLGPVAVAGFLFAFYEKDMPASRWLLVALFLYLLPAWLFIDVAFVTWNDINFWLSCHDRACANHNVGWSMLVTYSGLFAIELMALAMVGGLALLRFRYLRRNYNW